MTCALISVTRDGELAACLILDRRLANAPAVARRQAGRAAACRRRGGTGGGGAMLIRRWFGAAAAVLALAVLRCASRVRSRRRSTPAARAVGQCRRASATAISVSRRRQARATNSAIWSPRTTSSAACCATSASTCSSANCCSTRWCRTRRPRWCWSTRSDHVVYANLAARASAQRRPALERLSFRRDRRRLSAGPLRAGARDAARTACSACTSDGEEETFHLSQRAFRLQGRPHRLLPVKRLTRELSRQEVADLEESDPRDQPRAQQFAGADLLAGAFRPRARAARRHGTPAGTVFDTIEERTRHLDGFIARLCAIRASCRSRGRESVEWHAVPRRAGASTTRSALHGAAAGRAGLVRSRAARAGADQPAQERARIRQRRRRGRDSASAVAAAICASRCATAAAA